MGKKLSDKIIFKICGWQQSFYQSCGFPEGPNSPLPLPAYGEVMCVSKSLRNSPPGTYGTHTASSIFPVVCELNMTFIDTVSLAVVTCCLLHCCSVVSPSSGYVWYYTHSFLFLSNFKVCDTLRPPCLLKFLFRQRTWRQQDGNGPPVVLGNIMLTVTVASSCDEPSCFVTVVYSSYTYSYCEAFLGTALICFLTKSWIKRSLRS